MKGRMCAQCTELVNTKAIENLCLCLFDINLLGVGLCFDVQLCWLFWVETASVVEMPKGVLLVRYCLSDYVWHLCKGEELRCLGIVA